MDNYFQDTISKIYGDDDDFVVIGLTGRTGSGCSTVANILSSKQEEIRHSLFSGHNPKDNVQRKQKVVFNCFKHNWEPFVTIQASTVLLMMLSEVSIEDSGVFIGRSGDLEPDAAKKLLISLSLFEISNLMLLISVHCESFIPNFYQRKTTS